MTTKAAASTGSDSLPDRDPTWYADPVKAKAVLDGVVAQIQDGTVDPETGRKKLRSMVKMIEGGRRQIERLITAGKLPRTMLRKIAAVIQFGKEWIDKVRTLSHGANPEPVAVGA